MRRPAPERRRPSGTTGQATVEWVGLVVAVALLGAAVGLAVRHDLPDRIAGALLAAFHPEEPATGAPQASEATLAYARAALSPTQDAASPGLHSARALLVAELGPTAGPRLLDDLLVADLAARRPEWFGVQQLPLRRVQPAGVSRGVRTTTPAGPVVVHVVTPADEAGVTTGGRDEALRTWFRNRARDRIMEEVAYAIDADLRRSGAGRLPRGVVGVAPTVIGALLILRAESEEGWPGIGETAGDAILCRPVLVHTVYRVPGAERDGTTRPGIRLAAVHAGEIVRDAVSTEEETCVALGA